MHFPKLHQVMYWRERVYQTDTLTGYNLLLFIIDYIIHAPKNAPILWGYRRFCPAILPLLEFLQAIFELSDDPDYIPHTASSR